jgi:hypothetical protein
MQNVDEIKFPHNDFVASQLYHGDVNVQYMGLFFYVCNSITQLQRKGRLCVMRWSFVAHQSAKQ